MRNSASTPPPSDTPFPDSTVISTVAHLFVSPKDGILLAAIDVCPYPGDPSDEDYDVGIPDSHPAFVWIVSTVIRKLILLEDSKTLTFDLAVSEYTWGSKQTFVISCVHLFLHFVFILIVLHSLP